MLREIEQYHFKKYLMAIESYFWIPSKKNLLEANLSCKKSRQSNTVVIYCAMKGKLALGPNPTVVIRTYLQGYALSQGPSNFWISKARWIVCVIYRSYMIHSDI